MFTQREGDTIEIIEGLPCAVPPIGVVYINGKPKTIGVYKSHRLKSEQYWQLDERWKKYKQWVEEETKRKKIDKDYVNIELVKFINECWTYRLGGYWFYNNGVPTYITGKHWYYLCCYQMDIGLPKYRDIDRQVFYLWSYCEEDPECQGLLYLTKRRSGKSYIGGMLSVEQATRNRKYFAGMQSKTEDDAKKLFRRCVISPYKTLPYFFKAAKTNMDKGRLPEKELLFRDSKADGDFDNELDSKIDYQSSKEVAYDGSKLKYYFADEIGKPQDVDINNRWSVVQFCLKDEEGKIIGKSFHTTTVEDMEGGNTAMIRIWQGSDQNNKVDGTKRTATGLYRFFVPGHKARCIDRYGFADEEKAQNEILMERKSKENDPSELAALIRKDPMTIEEAFLSDSNVCVFNPIKLNDRETELRFSEKAYITGDFVFVGEKWGDVEFVPNPLGKIMMSKRFIMPLELKNRHNMRDGIRVPANNALFSMGVDPYDHKIIPNQENKDKLSKGSFAVMYHGGDNYGVYDMDMVFVCFYKHRHINPLDFYADTIKAMIYFGSAALIEYDKAGIINEMARLRLDEFAYRIKDKPQRGIKASLQNTEEGTSLLSEYINLHIGKVDYLELITEWLKFSPDYTTPFDGTMAVIYALLQYNMKRPKRVVWDKPKRDIQDYLSFYKR